jgi:hypothetical protein
MCVKPRNEQGSLLSVIPSVTAFAHSSPFDFLAILLFSEQLVDKTFIRGIPGLARRVFHLILISCLHHLSSTESDESRSNQSTVWSSSPPQSLSDKATGEGLMRKEAVWLVAVAERLSVL